MERVYVGPFFKRLSELNLLSSLVGMDLLYGRSSYRITSLEFVESRIRYKVRTTDGSYADLSFHPMDIPTDYVEYIKVLRGSTGNLRREIKFVSGLV